MGFSGQLQGALFDTTTTVAAAGVYAVTDSDQIVYFTSAAATTPTLPALAGPPSSINREMLIVNAGTGVCTVTPAGGQTINGVGTYVLTQNQGVRLFGGAAGSATNWLGTNIVATPTTAAANTLAFGADSIGAAADTRFLYPWYSETLAQTTGIPIIAIQAGTLRNLRVKHGVAGGNANTIVYTVLVNGVATLITVTIAANSTVMVSDLVNTAPVVAGDLITLRAVKAVGIAGSPNDVVASLGVG